VVALSGKPKLFPSEEGAHFGSNREKNAMHLKMVRLALLPSVLQQQKK
jgi:hypothetical protein